LRSRKILAGLVCLALVACGGSSGEKVRVPESEAVPGDEESFDEQSTAPAPAPPKDLCVVLSVGAEQGLAHMGVLLALRERGVPIGCVVGTSMGALVGGLYAQAPEEDLALRYSQIFAEYERQTREDVGPLGVGLLFGVGTRDWRRLRSVLRTTFRGARLESLSIPFATEHQIAEGSGIRREVVSGGLLGDEVAASIANPFLFSDIKAEDGTRIDPGADRVSAVPLQAACELHPDMQFLVSNVTGSPAFLGKGTSCSFQELKFSPLKVDASRAIRGKEPELRRLILAGYRGALKGIDWEKLPKGDSDFSNPLEFVSLQFDFAISEAKANGSAWDAFGGLPDAKVEVRFRAAPGVSGVGTSAGSSYSFSFEDSLRGRLELPVVALREGMTIEIELIDEDLRDDDEVAELSFAYASRKLTPVKASELVQVKSEVGAL